MIQPHEPSFAVPEALKLLRRPPELGRDPLAQSLRAAFRTSTCREALLILIDRAFADDPAAQRDPIIQHIALTLRAELENPGPFKRSLADGRGLSQRQLLSIVDYIHDNLARDLSVAELAAVSGVSASHFKVLFKQSIGQPVHKYVVRCRVEHAVRLLLLGQLTLSDIALQAGFSDQSHMARCMRRVIGVTPSDVLQSRA